MRSKLLMLAWLAMPAAAATAAAPQVAAVTPTTITAGASVIEVTGAGFAADSSVRWDGAPVPTLFVAPDLLLARVPAQPAGAHSVSAGRAGALSAPYAVQVSVDPRYLHVSGAALADRSGQTVHLRGFNLGGWLVTEGWMDGSTGDRGRSALPTLEARFGTAAAAALIERWRGNWITAADLALLQGWGVTALRVPLDWRDLLEPGSIDAAGALHGTRLVQDAASGIIRPSAGRVDFRHLDWIVAQAAARGMRVVFDLHVWEGQLSGPGAQPYQQISCFCTGAATERAQAAMLWTVVASHFKGNGTVAGMDVINEPNGSPGDTVQHQLLAGVRAGDPERVGFIEWVWWGAFAQDWPNSAYSTHYPPVMTAAWAAANLPAGVPVYMGEIKAPADTAAGATALAGSLNGFGYDWTVWTYKGVNVGGWAMFDYIAGIAAVNPASAAYATLWAAWGAPLTAWQRTGQGVTSNLSAGLLAGYRAAMAP